MAELRNSGASFQNLCGGFQNFHGGFQNLHTHTTYCDGTLPPEEMIKAALVKGCGSIGFSEHSYVPFDYKYSMDLDETREYISEIKSLKKKYEDTIEVFLGIEQDYYSEGPTEGFDYIIGTAHYVSIGDGFITIDAGAKNQKHTVDAHFGGDYYSLAEKYFETIAGIMKKMSADIIGHFDLITKYNFGGSLFDETRPRYISAALDSMEEILKTCKLFEVNTGAMYRLNKPEPYPSEFLLGELCKRGGEVILSSDSHDTDSLGYKFNEMRQLLKTCGFRYIKRLTGNGFVNEKLD